MYKIIGADQKDYGPVNADELRAWIGQRRANGQTLVMVESGPWKPLSTYPEFADALRAAAASAPPSLAQAAIAGRPPKTNGMAIAGLIMGIVSVTFGLFCCVPLFNILGVIFSIVALSQIKANPDQQTGRGMAIAGLILSLLGLILFSILLAFGFLSGFIESVMRHGN